MYLPPVPRSTFHILVPLFFLSSEMLTTSTPEPHKLKKHPHTKANPHLHKHGLTSTQNDYGTWLVYTPLAFLALAHVGAAILLPEKAISGLRTGSACIITTFTPRELFMTAKFLQKMSGRFQSFLATKYIRDNKSSMTFILKIGYRSLLTKFLLF